MRRAMLALVAAAAWAAGAGAAAAQIYRWTDERGVNHYTEGLDNVPERYRAGAVPLGLRNAPAGARAVPAGEPGAARSATIRYVPGLPILVDVRINGTATARLMLDTGADRTLISPRALAAAGVSLTRPVARGRLAGVTGTDQAHYVVVDSLEIGEVRVDRLPVVAYEMPQSPGDGLLGRDVLDQFSVAIDAARGVVTLTPR